MSRDAKELYGVEVEDEPSDKQKLIDLFNKWDIAFGVFEDEFVFFCNSHSNNISGPVNARVCFCFDEKGKFEEILFR